MNALLVRVGIDQAYGQWNAPVNPTSGEFVYLPIPEKPEIRFHSGLERRYTEFFPALKDFGTKYICDSTYHLKLPGDLLNRAMHLDPDFDELTYGDVGSRRGAKMTTMTQGDMLAFYAGLRPIREWKHKLMYALIGVYVVDEVIPVAKMPKARWKTNAHTRRKNRGISDIVVKAKEGVSGRLKRCVPIGEWRNRAYRVRPELLEAWGGLSVRNGYIQRSAVPPSFLDPTRFCRWFLDQEILLLRMNNPPF